MTSRAGLRVPPGFVLTVRFFEPWLDRLKATRQWRAFVDAPPEDLPRRCAALKAVTVEFRLPADHESVLVAAAAHSRDTRFAVRSSSPEEDLEAASFAGGYETVLNVAREELAAAVARAFASCLDYRVVVYKQEHGFDTHDPRIAVIVQEQIASETAGVAFSLNPVTNDHDEAVINASRGLGEAVVSGRVTPDLFVVDKPGMRLKEASTGNDKACLSEPQVLDIVRLLDHVDALYDRPMDIEWTFAGGELFLLQARPVTGYVPLSPRMMTAPGHRRRLYWDATLGGQGIARPLSVMGTSILDRVVGLAFRIVYGIERVADIDASLPWIQDGRAYLNLSNALAVAGKNPVASGLEQVDPLTAATLRALDEDMYRSPSFRPRWSTVISIAERVVRILPTLVHARFSPASAHRRMAEALARHEAGLDELCRRRMPLEDFSIELFRRTLEVLHRHVLPVFAVSRLAIVQARHMFRDSHAEDIERVDRSLPHNVTVQMGLELYELATMLPAGTTAAEIESGLAADRLPDAFRAGWARFLRRYGHRGPVELDIASSRYRDSPRVLLEQLAGLAAEAVTATNPRARFERHQEERRAAYEKLTRVLESQSRLKRWRFRSLYRVIEHLGGLRETPKFHVIRTLDRLRTRILAEAEQLTRAGRLDRPAQVFDLEFGELVTALADSSLDLRAAAARNRAFPDRLARVLQLPALIDSRGRILRPPRPRARPGEVAGLPIAPGVATGPVKVLRHPDEKPLNPGEILVARATDPGWTPLFVNAAAVVLEIGGMLQHGALVAREYGIPCVGGVEGATALWRDGTVVEVDGTAGVVRASAGG